MEDTAIVELYWQRNSMAITETEKKYGAYCQTIAFNILANHEDAEECVNDTYLGAWNSMPDNRPSVLAPYLAKITRWQSIARLRKNTRLKRGGGEYELALEELGEGIPSPVNVEKTVEQNELASAVNSFVAGLSLPERRIFLLRYWQAMSLASIAETLGFSLPKTKSILHRTRVKLQCYLKKEGLC